MRDDAVAELIRQRLFPQMSRDEFSHSFLVDAKGIDDFVMAELYVKRGDMYAKLGKKYEARKEYDRVVRGFPESAQIYLENIDGRWVRKADAGF